MMMMMGRRYPPSSRFCSRHSSSSSAVGRSTHIHTNTCTAAGANVAATESIESMLWEEKQERSWFATREEQDALRNDAVLESVRCPILEPIIFSRTAACVSFPWAHFKGNELLSFLFDQVSVILVLLLLLLLLLFLLNAFAFAAGTSNSHIQDMHQQQSIPPVAPDYPV